MGKKLVAIGGALASPLGGGIAAFIWRVQSCRYEWVGGQYTNVCPDANANLALAVTVIGWGLTALGVWAAPRQSS